MSPRGPPAPAPHHAAAATPTPSFPVAAEAVAALSQVARHMRPCQVATAHGKLDPFRHRRVKATLRVHCCEEIGIECGCLLHVPPCGGDAGQIPSPPRRVVRASTLEVIMSIHFGHA